MSASHWFSKSYLDSKKRFLASINELSDLGYKVKTDHLLIEAKGSHEEELTIDIAVVGSLESEKMLISSSGVHGVEGYPGSAIQLSIIDEMKKTIMFSDVCIIFIHSINPYGMSWLRRVNENNVDLNRNFLEKHEGEPEGYKLIDKFVNAPGLPKKFDPTFYIQGIQLLVRYGFTNIKQWFAQGQYTRPKSLQYGGDKLQEGPSLILEWLKKNLQKTKEIFAIDLHTGLGPSGFDTILIPEDISEEKYKLLISLFDSHVTSLDPVKGVGYKITGDIHAGLVSEFPSINWICITQEFGTFKPMSVLKSLRSENKWTNFNNEKDLVNVKKHWSRSDLLHVFNPEDPIWQEKLISRGNIVFNIALDYLLEN